MSLEILLSAQSQPGLTVNNSSLEPLNISNNFHFIENKSSFINNSEEINYVPYELRPETYVVPILFALIFVVGLIGNGTLIYVFFRFRSMRTIPNMYIMSLAFGDLIVITGTIPFVSTIYTFESWPYGEFVCKISEFIRDVSIGVTVLTLTMLSAERYVAIVLPMRHFAQQDKTKLIAVAIWLIAIILALPGAYNSFVWEVKITNNKMIYVCYPFPDELGEWYPKMIVLLKFLILYAIPLLLIALFYVLIACHLMKSSKKPIGQSISHSKQVKSRTKIAKIVLGFVVIFAICFFPNHVFMLWYYFHPQADEYYNGFWHVWRMVGFVLAFLNSCLNPVALYIISGVFRAYFKKYLFWCCYKNHHPRFSKLPLRSLQSHSIELKNKSSKSSTISKV